MKEKDNNIFKKDNLKVRVRFAPSPTGFFHIGGARTALFNFLFARKYQGKMILRIEDTDLERSKKEYEEDIMEGLKWLGIEWDEGPIFKKDQERIFDTDYIGHYGPYRQSERKNIYRKYLEKLLEEKKAYYCFCTPEELKAKREEQMSRGLPPRYDGKCAHLSEKEVKERLEKGMPAVIRFKVPKEKISFVDEVRGKIEFDANLLGDIVIAKNLNTPLYNFAAVVDDFEMRITHIIRGEDHLPNTPKQILLQKALGFYQPVYIHIPLILGPDRSKLSKRHGAMSVNEYKKMGYLPEAMINFLAFLGWNPGTEKEIYSLSSLIKDFSVKKIQKSGAIFNTEKLDYLNGFYIRQTPREDLTRMAIPYLIEKDYLEPIIKSEQYPPAYGGIYFSQSFKIKETKEKINFNHLERIVQLFQERLKKVSEIGDLADFFFKERLDYPKELLFWKEAREEGTLEVLEKIKNLLSPIKEENWNRETIEKILMSEAEKLANRGYFLWPLRVALTGKKASPGPFEIAEILGKSKTLKRIEYAKSLLQKRENQN